MKEAQRKEVEFTNWIYPDELVHDEPSHLDLQSLNFQSDKDWTKKNSENLADVKFVVCFLEAVRVKTFTSVMPSLPLLKAVKYN